MLWTIRQALSSFSKLWHLGIEEIVENWKNVHEN